MKERRNAVRDAVDELADKEDDWADDGADHAAERAALEATVAKMKAQGELEFPDSSWKFLLKASGQCNDSDTIISMNDGIISMASFR